MSARIIDGTAVAAAVRADVARRTGLMRADGTQPGLAVLLVGDDPASHVYVRSKARACDEAGMLSEVVALPATATMAEVLGCIERFNANPAIHGILCQLPLPPQIDAAAVISRIDPAKDVDGLHPLNVGKVAIGDLSGFRPATPFGVQQLLRSEGIPIAGSRVVIVGRSALVGRPLAQLLSQPGAGGDATVTLAHSRSRDLPAICREAEVLVVATGRPGMIGADAIRPGATVIDVGTSRVADPTHPRGYRLAGDVRFDEVREVAGAITPVPGGVGPMTIAMLLVNTLQAAGEPWT